MEDMAAKQKPAHEESENEISELAYDYAWRSVDRATGHFEKVDTKIATLGGFVGVMISVLITLVPAFFPAGQFQTGFAFVAQLLFALCVVMLMASLLACLSALKPRTMTDWPLSAEFIKMHLSKPLGETCSRSMRQAFVQRLSEVDLSYMKAASSKVWHVNLALVCLALSLGSLAGSGVSALTHSILKSYEPATTNK